MNPHLAYKKAASLSWSRVDMLITVYDEAIKALESGAEALEENPGVVPFEDQFRVVRTVSLLADGANPEHSDVAVNVLRLCHFISGEIQTTDADRWQHSAKLLQELRDGFSEIREEAIRLEATGKIPALDVS